MSLTGSFCTLQCRRPSTFWQPEGASQIFLSFYSITPTTSVMHSSKSCVQKLITSWNIVFKMSLMLISKTNLEIIALRQLRKLPFITRTFEARNLLENWQNFIWCLLRLLHPLLSRSLNDCRKFKCKVSHHLLMLETKLHALSQIN